jgi:hypothetical protein
MSDAQEVDDRVEHSSISSRNQFAVQKEDEPLIGGKERERNNFPKPFS